MQWLLEIVGRFLTVFSELLITPVLSLGDQQFSIGSVILLVALAIAIFLASRRISEWIKRRLLSRLERGLREAIAALTSYLLALFGVLILLQTAGIDLSSLTVLAGVLGIGIGFGLQNLASNFISGLTLLFEQPIKVGDFIEIDGLMGTVEKISIRSTIVRTNDDVFVIVPNLRFVEQNIINWSYRQPYCRLHLPISVAYGTDPVLVTEALLEAAHKEPLVLSKPSPKVWFIEFGESGLNFELLVWVDTPEDSEPIKSSLNYRINQEFQQRHIEIPYPQQDIHIRSIHGLEGFSQRKEIPSPPVMAEPNGSDPNGKGPILSTSATVQPTISNLNLRDLLRRVAYFEHCSELELRQLIEYGYRQLFPAHQVICRENDPGDSFYIILTGCVEVFSQRANQYIATLHAGEFFGEMSLLLGMPRSATVRTLVESTLFIVDRRDLQKLLVNHQELADQIAHKLAERQQVLREMGLSTEGGLPSDTPFFWMRRQIQTLFGI